MSHARAKFDVSGRVACITGAGSGIGLRAAMVLKAAGADVVGIAHPSDDLERLIEVAGHSNNVVVADLSLRPDIAGAARQVGTPFGAPDILVHAVDTKTHETADHLMPEDWDRVMNDNLTAPFFLTQALVPAMKARGWGRVLTVATTLGERAISDSVAEGVASTAIGQLTRSMAEAWSPDGINVNTMVLGAVNGGPAGALSRADQNHEGSRPARAAELKDVDGPLLFLCSDASAYVTGQVLMVDGGRSAV